MLKEYDASGGNNWVSDIKNMLCTYGFGDVWLNQGVGNADLFVYTFKQRLIDMSVQTWHDDVSNNSKLHLYRNFKTSLDFELYLSTDVYWKHKVALARLRCVNHKLAIERHRYLKCDRNERHCKYCKQNGLYIIEDEIHFILVCPMFEHLRNIHISKYIVHTLNATENFVKIVSSKQQRCIKDLCAFVYYAFILHAEYNEL